jgi:hypothetical protein
LDIVAKQEVEIAGAYIGAVAAASNLCWENTDETHPTDNSAEANVAPQGF